MWTVYLLQRVLDVPAVARNGQVPEREPVRFLQVGQGYRTSQDLLIPLPALNAAIDTPWTRAAGKMQRRQDSDVQRRHTMKKVFPGTMLLILMLIFPLPTMARVDIDINISLPPPVRFVEPPELVVLPGTYVYAVPDADVDIFFYDGWWWRSWDSHWYRSREYSSGWVYYENVPTFYREVPPDWRHYYRERRWRGHAWHYQRIPHHRVQTYWRDWERDRYWEHQQTWGVPGYRFSAGRRGKRQCRRCPAAARRICRTAGTGRAAGDVCLRRP